MTPPPIVIVGEALGELEARIGSSFVGPSGASLLRMLHEAKIIELSPDDKKALSLFYSTNEPKHVDRVWQHQPSVFRTNVFNLHPAGNDLDTLCGPKAQALGGYPAIKGSRYIRAEFEPELDRLANDILDHNPNLVVCLGNAPLWALAGRVGIKKWRGSTLLSSHTVADYKLLPTYHPAYVLRDWPVRPFVIADLMKAQREAAFPELRRPHRDIWIEPTLGDIEHFLQEHIHRPINGRCNPLSVDIETSGSRITCLGLGYSDIALVIPFDDERTKGGNYWPTQEAERAVWELTRGVLEDRSIPKLFQNGLYDIAFLWRSMGIKVLGATHDTMLLHHALQPEMIKDLGFLGSIYSDEGTWEHLGAGKRKKARTIKRDA